jgi:hypothetical protein
MNPLPKETDNTDQGIWLVFEPLPVWLTFRSGVALFIKFPGGKGVCCLVPLL